MQVDTNVGEADVASLRLDQQANFAVDAYPGQIFSGKIWQIRQAPINVQNVITYDVVIAVSNPDLKLFPGMTANVTIFTSHALNALRIPKAALRFHPRAAAGASAKSAHAPGSSPLAAQQAQPMQTIYVLDDHGQPKPLQVRLGISDSNYVQVLDGTLREGQELVVGMKGPAAATPAQAQGGGTRRFGF